MAKNHGTIEFGSTDFDTDPQFGTPCWIERRSRSTKQAITATNDDNRRAATPHDYPATAFCIAGWGFPGTVEYTAATFNVPRGRFPDPNEYATTPFDTVRRCHGRRAFLCPCSPGRLDTHFGPHHGKDHDGWYCSGD